MDLVTVLALTAALFAYGLVSRRLEGTPLTGPLLFTAFGVVVGPLVVGMVAVETGHGAIHLLAEVTLVLVLFSDAAEIDLRQLRRDHDLPVRMLVLGMPASLLLGTLVAKGLFTPFTWLECALLAAILVPTDAALGQAVVSDRAVPVRIRQALNVESGLNDGIALPFVLLFAALASMGASASDPTHWLTFGALQITLGPLVGLGVGFVGARLVGAAHGSQWMTEGAEGIAALALAFGSFTAAELVHGNGFIAAFVAGLTFGNVLQHRCQFLYEFAETEGRILTLLTFAAFGALMIPLASLRLTFGCVLFSLLALTVIRMVPVQLSLLGTGVRPVTALFLGWFGPRGLASVLFVLLILEESEVAHSDQILAIVTTTVTLSVLLHGITAGPGARWYGRRVGLEGELEEHRAVGEHPFSNSG